MIDKSHFGLLPQDVNKQEYINECDLSVHTTKDYCNLLSSNINGIKEKMHYLEDLTENGNIDIICLQEIGNPRALSLKGKKSIHTIRDDENNTIAKNKAGGLAIFSRYDICLVKQEIRENIEYQVCRIKLPDKTELLICNTYIPPQVKKVDAKNILLSILEDLAFPKHKRTAILGDLNINYLKDPNLILEIALHVNSVSHTILPTRVTSHSETAIDHAIIKDENAKTAVVKTDYSDHFSVLVSLKYTQKTQLSGKMKKRTRCMNKACMSNLNDSLCKVDWNLDHEIDPEQALNNFYEKFYTLFNMHCPIKYVSEKHIVNKPWFTTGLSVSKREKINKLNLFLRLKRKKTLSVSAVKEAYLKYKLYASVYYKVVKLARNSYFKKLLENTSSVARKWSVAKEAMNISNSKSELPKAFKNDDGSLDESEAKIAEGFCKFFTNVGPDTASQIKKSNYDFKHFLSKARKPDVNFVFKEIGQFDLCKIIEELKSKHSNGLDEISNNLLKRLKYPLLEPLTKIFNLSLRTGMVPSQLKCAIIHPIYKSGESMEYTNYRPISILSSISKLLEKIVCKQITTFLEEQNLLFSRQYGFREGRSTIHALCELMRKIDLEKSEGNHTLGLFLDVKKAFDCVEHTILLSKLEHYGIRNSELNWFTNYLQNRTQMVKIGDHMSGKQTIEMGVPQGSILGPVLFLIYVNDLGVSSNLFVMSFADDTALLNSRKNITELVTDTQKELVIIEQWFTSNRLSLHPAKSKLLIFLPRAIRNSNIPPIFLMGQEVSRVQESNPNTKDRSFKYVGVHLDENLTFKYHTIKIHRTMIYWNYLLNCGKYKIPKSMRLAIYNSLIKPHLEYAIEIWGNTYVKYLRSLKTAQKNGKNAPSKKEEFSNQRTL